MDIKNLNYTFDDSNVPVLKNISVKIKENTSVAIIGNSGGGKSTLFNVISKLLQVENNKVFIGNKDINKLCEEEFRNNISLINQDTFLFNDTVMNNLKMVGNFNEKDIYKACKQANIHNEIICFEKGYDTIITEHGNNLSGGQKQRIAIARALLKNTSIILFDEPTSALDNTNQAIFYNILKNLQGKKTIIVITHKLNDFAYFDKVLELNNGKVVTIKK